MKVRNHFLMLGVLLGAVSALRLGTASHFNRQFQAVGKEAAQKHSRQIEAAWKRHAYSDLASAHTEQAILSKIPWPSLALSEVQQAKLRLRVQEVLRYLEQPSFDEYYRLKTEGLHWSLEPQGYASSLLGMSTQHRTTVSPSDEPKGAVRFMWENAGASEKPSPPKLAAVCVDTLTGSTGRTNTGRALLTGSVKRGFTAAVEAVDPGFVYTAAASSKAPLLFQLSFLAKANGSENAGPVYVSLLWVEGDGNWAPNRLITDSWLRIKTIF
ncbi:MAG: hypothetical protein ACLQVX_04530 [Limisphaerales bacterium]